MIYMMLLIINTLYISSFITTCYIDINPQDIHIILIYVLIINLPIQRGSAYTHFPAKNSQCGIYFHRISAFIKQNIIGFSTCMTSPFHICIHLPIVSVHKDNKYIHLPLISVHKNIQQKIYKEKECNSNIKQPTHRSGNVPLLPTLIYICFMGAMLH